MTITTTPSNSVLITGGTGKSGRRVVQRLQTFSEHFLVDPVISGEIAFPADGVAEPFVDLEDVADGAVEALTGVGHHGRIYELISAVLDGRNAHVTTDVARILGLNRPGLLGLRATRSGRRGLDGGRQSGMTDWMDTATVAAATVTTGLFAGLFYTFATAVMVGLHDADDRTFVIAMQSINVRITNGWFLISFVAPIPLWVLAGALHLGDPSVLPWIAAALGCCLAVVVITAAVNVPLNNRLATTGDPGQAAEVAAVRRSFEPRWVRWNAARSVFAVAALAAAVGALLAHARFG